MGVVEIDDLDEDLDPFLTVNSEYLKQVELHFVDANKLALILPWGLVVPVTFNNLQEVLVEIDMLCE